MYELAVAPYPFNLPFNFPLEEIRKYLAHFNTSLAGIYEALFAPAGIVNREQLEISPEEEKIITTRTDNAAQLSEYYNRPLKENDLNGLEKVSDFTQQTGLTTDNLNELLYQRLTQDEILNVSGDYKLQSTYDGITITLQQENKKVTGAFQKTTEISVQIEGTIDGHILNAQWKEQKGNSTINTGSWLVTFDAYGKSFEGIVFTNGKKGNTPIKGVNLNNTYQNVLNRFYINQVLKDTYLLSEARFSIDLPPNTYLQIKHLNLSTLDRLNRFIRLASYLQWNFTDLDWTLQSLGLTTADKDIDTNIIEDLAKINHLKNTWKLSVDTTCSLFGDMRTTGKADDSTPRSFFDNVFNFPTYFYNPPGTPDPKPYHPEYAGNPFYKDDILEWTFYKDPATTVIASNDKDNAIRLRLMAALEVDDAGLTAIAQFIYKQEPNSSANKTLSLTVEVLSKLYRIAQLAAVTRMNIPSFIRVYNLVTMDCVKPLDNLVQVGRFIQWMQEAAISIDQIDYILNGALNKDIIPPFRIADTGLVLHDIDRNASSWMVNSDDFTFRNIDTDASAYIVQQLRSQAFVSHEGIVLQKKIGFDTIHTLIRLNSASLVASSINEQQAIQAFTDLVSNGYIATAGNDQKGYVTTKYNEAADLSFLFKNEELQKDMIEEVKDILNHILGLHALLGVTPLSFVVKNNTDTGYLIDEKESARIYGALLDNDAHLIYIDLNGILLSSWHDTADLDFLFSHDDDKKDVKTAEVRTILTGAKNNIDHIVSTLDNIRLQQQQGVLEVLTNYFSAEPELLRVILFELVCKLKDIDYMKLLLQPGRTHSEILELEGLFTFTSRWLYLMQTLPITSLEAAGIVQKPTAFDLPAIDSHFVLSAGNLISLYRFKQLVQQFKDQDNALANYLVNSKYSSQALSDISGWSSNQIDLLQQFSGEFNLGTVSGLWKLKTVFDMSGAAGVDVSILLSLFKLGAVSLSDPSKWNIYQENRMYLYDAVKASYNDQAWQSVYDVISNAFLEDERDALVGYFIARKGEALGIINGSDLYQYLLLDVDMAGNVTTSPIQQGIATVQLYIQRCMMNLEEGVEKVNIEPVWWEWMSSYRVWEANRKVFLYPENYFDPLLRKASSEIYQEFCGQLNESEITDENITNAYQNYLSKFAMLANLEMVDAYFIDRPKDLQTVEVHEDTLFVFGRTNTEPYQYYYRTARVHFETNSYDLVNYGPNVLDWDYWHEMKISIQSKFITPVFIFNRLYIFWVEINKGTTASFSAGTSIDTITYKASIKYSFYNFQKNWSSPQTLCNDIVISVSPDTYVETEMEQYIDKLNMNFDLDNPFWNKVYLFTYDDGSGNPNLMICFGDLIKLPALPIDKPDPPNKDKNDDTDAFNQSFYRAVESARKAYNYNIKGFSSFVPVTTLNYNLQTSQQYLVFQNVDYTTVKPYRGCINSMEGSLIVAETNNIMYDNYMMNFAPPEISGVMIAGGEESDTNNSTIVISDLIDNYDNITYNWSVEKLSEPRSNLCSIAAGNKILFAGGRAAYKNGVETLSNVIDIYNGNSGQWSTAKLSEAKAFPVAATIDEWIFIAGGELRPGVYSATIDYYNTTTGSLNSRVMSMDQSVEMVGLAVCKGLKGDISVLAIFNNRTCFYYNPFTNTMSPVYTTYVDPLYVATVGRKAWIFSTVSICTIDLTNGAQDSIGAASLDYNMAFTVCGDYIFFAGGSKADVQVYNTVSRSWEKQNRKLSKIRGYLTASSIGTKVIFAGGYSSPDRLNTVDIFDAANPNFHTTPQLRKARANLTSVPVNISTDLSRNAEYVKLLRKLPAKSKGLESVKNVPGWFMVNTGAEQFLVMPKDPFIKQIKKIVKVEPLDSFDGIPINKITTRMYTDNPINWKTLPFQFLRLTTQTIQSLSNRLFIGGFNKLLDPSSQMLKELSFQDLYDPAPNADTTKEGYVPDDISFALSNPWSGYFKEVFFYIPLLIADSLQVNQQFEAAKKWYEYIFNPTATDRSTDEYYWRFTDLREIAAEPLEKILTDESQINAYKDDPFDPDAIVWHRKTALQKAVVMKYIKNLISWGDQLFTQDMRESIGQAALLYMLSADLLGKKPSAPALCNKPNTKTFRDILNKYQDDIPDFLIELESFYIPPTSCNYLPKNPVQSLNAYFGIMENPEFTQYWDIVEDRLFKIRHSLSIQGIERTLSLYGSPIDPRLLQRAAVAGINSGAIGQYPVPLYRFNYMLDRAKNLTNSLIQLGNSLLSVIEKKDAEQLALLRAGQELTMLRLQRNIKEQQITDAVYMVESAQQSAGNAQARIDFYNERIEKGLLPSENESLEDMYQGMIFNEIGGALRAASSAGYALPNVGAPTAMTYGGQQIGAALGAYSAVFETVAAYYNYQSQRKSINAGYERRAQEWNLQLQLANWDKNQFEASVNAALVRKAIAEQDLANHDRAIAQSNEVENFLVTKFSNKELYQWMLSRLSVVYFQTYKLAYDAALAAEKALQYERDMEEKYIINTGYWDSLKKGLMAGESLLLSLNQMEKAYLANNVRELEIERTISLRALNEGALTNLRDKGVALFDLSEGLYDSDFAGHYKRKIKSISISIPAVVGPYQNLNAMLTQTANKIILKADLNAVNFLLGNNKTKEPDGNTLRSNWRTNQVIALYSGINDNGVFELNYRDERYLPFEGTGAVSSWKLQIDNKTIRKSISDVIIKVRYTAYYGGKAFATEVSELVN